MNGCKTALYWMLLATMALAMQERVLAQTPKPDDKTKTDSKKNQNTATQNAADQPMYDPVRAEKDLEVGQYYMRIGKVDSAIDRFQDAVDAHPGYAIPFKYLGEAYEKKKEYADAVKAYTRYLDLYPHAEDKTKIEKKIEKLREEAGKKKK